LRVWAARRSLRGVWSVEGCKKTGVRSSALFIFRSGLLPLFLVDYLFQHIEMYENAARLVSPGYAGKTTTNA
jgi:hypothetical protein